MTTTADKRAPDILEDTQTGSRIDDFTIAYRIAHGMTADVFAVWHHRLRTPLVCKRLRPADEDYAKWRKLLRAEAAALAQLNHPGIVRLVAQNMRARLPYLLLEHIDGKTLRDELTAQGCFPADVAVRLVQHTGAALAHAHDKGYVHRDLKPSNIILRGGRPVLLDFGVVWKWKSARRPPDRSGTPQYLASEQILRAPLTPATDVYGLGLLLFEFITGERAFRASDAALRHDKRASLSARYPQLIEDAPLKLLRKKGTASRALEPIIARCLARDPCERYANVAQLLTAIDPFTSVKVWPQDAARERKDFSPFA
ncbi:MAG: serine/threonine-protein kinase [Pyrinomonadaceae bacterium]